MCAEKESGVFFSSKGRKISLKTEVIAGITTFLTMAYIIFVNPDVLSQAGMDKSALTVVTCIVTAVATVIVGVFGRAPIAMAPGMGLNAFFAYTLVQGEQIAWPTALGMVFLSGFIFLVFSIFGLRKKLVEAIPPALISAISVGIGLFITFIGLRNLGVVVDNEQTLVAAGKLTPTVLIGLFGLVVMVYLEAKGVTGSLLVGILVSTALAGLFGYIEVPETLFSYEFEITAVAFKLDILGALKWSLMGSIFSLVIMDLFDSIGTLAACCQQAGMVDENNKIQGLGRLLGIDALATMFGAMFGTSTTTAYIESAAGIEQGGRTGLTAVVTGICFLAAMLFVPLVALVPSYATAPALIMVGLFMMKGISRIGFMNLEEGFPAFIIIVMIALSYSITTGLAFGFISFTIIKSVMGKAGEIKVAMWIITALSIFFLMIDRMPYVIEAIKFYL